MVKVKSLVQCVIIPHLKAKVFIAVLNIQTLVG